MNSLYAAHIRTTRTQKFLLALGSGVGAFIDPTKDEYIATFGETTANQALRHMRRKMLADLEGSKILKERPLINSSTLDCDKLRSLPVGSFGAAYMNFLTANGVSPDTRKRVHFVTTKSWPM
ncbi:putative Ubiquinone biosynthesis protein COQ4-like protein, mitochondrial [Hypsibius exemplaris]|uniref:Ubiquinone biosynthesis protein COQ4-like protein, mitochondrial n=1 Tax=Hypsibius exemplaris TaxID=2072580 RepID=A0A1W0WEE6_HYPEX|nr:putative Ubiquinone biosynthesis protein COQ4-like protein, mitochondrial [Hypsibius exemplaris]